VAARLQCELDALRTAHATDLSASRVLLDQVVSQAAHEQQRLQAELAQQHADVLAAQLAAAEERQRQLTDEADRRVQQLTAVGWLPGSLAWLRDEVNAQVEGHVTIVPYLEWASLPRALSNPSADSLQWCITEAERGAFRRVETVRLRCAIERALTDAVHTARRLLLPPLAAAPDLPLAVTPAKGAPGTPLGGSPGAHRRRSHSLVLDAAAAEHAERGPASLPPRSRGSPNDSSHSPSSFGLAGGGEDDAASHVALALAAVAAGRPPRSPVRTPTTRPSSPAPPAASFACGRGAPAA
jgi:hypothetical protein